jgi:hypothetical protein
VPFLAGIISPSTYVALRESIHQKGGIHGSASTSKEEEREGGRKSRNTHFHAQFSFFVFVITVKLATCDIEASASPRNP